MSLVAVEYRGIVPYDLEFPNVMREATVQFDLFIEFSPTFRIMSQITSNCTVSDTIAYYLETAICLMTPIAIYSIIIAIKVKSDVNEWMVLSQYQK